MGLKQTQSTLFTEANLSNDYQICDNIDLDTIYLDYCSYFHLKFSKQPKVLKKCAETDHQSPLSLSATHTGKQKINKRSSNGNRGKKTEDEKKSSSEIKKTHSESVWRETMMMITGSASLTQSVGCENQSNEKITLPSKFLNAFTVIDSLTTEMRELADVVERDIVTKNCNIKWSDIHGHYQAKEILQESVILPFQHPDLFKNLTRPWNGILLHGPSGIGKTMLAKALCSETFGTVRFFNITSSTLISKWRGESEKYLKILFTMARTYAPSVIFIDEFESLASRRDSPNDHEASRRFKNQLLIQFDQLDDDNDHVLLLANSNLPWEIDVAFLRRFERKILIDMPNAQNRINLIKHLVPISSTWNTESLQELSNASDGLTGADLKIVCKEASMRQLRQALRCTPKQPKINQVSFDDLMEAMKQIQPTMADLAEKHRNWNKKYGNKLNW